MSQNSRSIRIISRWNWINDSNTFFVCFFFHVEKWNNHCTTLRSLVWNLTQSYFFVHYHRICYSMDIVRQLICGYLSLCFYPSKPLCCPYFNLRSDTCDSNLRIRCHFPLIVPMGDCGMEVIVNKIIPRTSFVSHWSHFCLFFLFFRNPILHLLQ